MAKHDNAGSLLAAVSPATYQRLLLLESSVKVAQSHCYTASLNAGWWDNAAGDRYTLLERQDQVPTKLMLIVSEVAEAMEGHRKNLLDDHLPWREQLEVELADALIRIFDLGGALGYDLAGAMAEKLAYNSLRADHTREARAAENGKRY